MCGFFTIWLVLQTIVACFKYFTWPNWRIGAFLSQNACLYVKIANYSVFNALVCLYCATCTKIAILKLLSSLKYISEYLWPSCCSSCHCFCLHVVCMEVTHSFGDSDQKVDSVFFFFVTLFLLVKFTVNTCT